MATETSNYHLTKPQPADYYDIALQNANLDKIDSQLKVLDDRAGVPGPIGPQGPKGEQGLKGDKGDRGEVGPQGLQGIQGPRGDKGDQGLKGEQGIQGLTGPVGPQGSVGLQGERGEQGLKGDKGDKGEIGPQGLQGVVGKDLQILGVYATLADLQGAKPTANPGEAYAVGTGESNTLYVWDAVKSLWSDLGSLRGPKGDQGQQGPKGEEGDKGDPGNNGVALSAAGCFAFNVTPEGHLTVSYPDADSAPDFSINNDGHLIYGF